MSAVFDLSRIQLAVLSVFILLAVLFSRTLVDGEDSQQSTEESVISGHEKTGDVAMHNDNLTLPQQDNSETFDVPELAGVKASKPVELVGALLDVEASAEHSQHDNLSIPLQQFQDLASLTENTLAPALSAQGGEDDTRMDREAVVSLLVSRLPDSLSEQGIAQVAALLRSYLPYDLADALLQESLDVYRLERRQAGFLAQVGTVTDMQEQIRVAQALADMSPSADMDASPQSADSFAYAEETPAENDDGAGSSEVREALEAQAIQWQQRYARFQKEKQVIDSAGLSENDKKLQITELLQQHYSENEWQAVLAYDASRQGEGAQTP